MALFVLCFMLFEHCVRFHGFSEVRVTEWPPIGLKLLTRLTICFLSTYKYLIVSSVFPASVFGLGISF